MGKRCPGLGFLTQFEACLLKYTAKPYFINIQNCRRLRFIVINHLSFSLTLILVVVMMMTRLMKMTILTLWGLIQVDGTWGGNLDISTNEVVSKELMSHDS
jgi:hypothetical protein